MRPLKMERKYQFATTLIIDLLYTPLRVFNSDFYLWYYAGSMRHPTDWLLNSEHYGSIRERLNLELTRRVVEATIRRRPNKPDSDRALQMDRLANSVVPRRTHLSASPSQASKQRTVLRILFDWILAGLVVVGGLYVVLGFLIWVSQ